MGVERGEFLMKGGGGGWWKVKRGRIREGEEGGWVTIICSQVIKGEVGLVHAESIHTHITRICSNIDMAELARTHQSCGLRADMANLRIEDVARVDLYPTS